MSDGALRRYTVLLFHDAGEDVYTALVPILPGCVSQGPTVQEAVNRAHEAIAGHVLSLAEAGDEIPIESEPPAVVTLEVELPEVAAV